MEWLHENKNDFADAINLASERNGVLPAVVEKDYYVTVILRCLSNRLDYVVFKGGTSLSKCHKVIKRFSEDIDITIDKNLTQSQKRELKQTIKEVAEKIGLRIPNINLLRSRRSYNRYILEYDSVVTEQDEAIQTAVLLETSFAEISFPTVRMSVHSYIGDLMYEEAPGQSENYGLDLFEMKVQGIDRTLVDKVFAICDYYMLGKVKKYSRHIYDIYKLIQIVPQDDAFKELIQQVRLERAKTNICPSAQPEIDIPDTLMAIVKNEVFKEDYRSITSRILEEPISYETAIQAVKKIAESGCFDSLS